VVVAAGVEVEAEEERVAACTGVAASSAAATASALACRMRVASNPMSICLPFMCIDADSTAKTFLPR
jgi:hypothetical protein